MKRICLLVLVGLPAAGKTTFCHWILNVPQSQYKILHFCYDEFFETNRFSHSDVIVNDIYKVQRQRIFEILETIVQSILNDQEIPTAVKSKISISRNDAQDNDYIILLDDNHYYRSMRYKIYQLCKTKSFAFGQVYFECPRQKSLTRNAVRSSGCLPTSVIERMSTRMETPSNVLHWEGMTLTINTECRSYSLERILNFVSKVFENIPKNEALNASSPNQAENSLLHSLDVLLRRRMGEFLAVEMSKDVKRIRATELNNRRKLILQQFRKFNLVEERLNEIVDLLNDNIDCNKK